MDPLPLTPDGEGILAVEIGMLMRLLARYKPEEAGGVRGAHEDFHQIAQDVVHMGALIASISPLAGESHADEVLSDYARKIDRGQRYSDLRGEDFPATGKKYTDAEAKHVCVVRAQQAYREHCEAIKTSEKIRNLIFNAKALIETLNRALERASKERRGYTHGSQ